MLSSQVQHMEAHGFVKVSVLLPPLHQRLGHRNGHDGIVCNVTSLDENMEVIKFLSPEL